MTPSELKILSDFLSEEDPWDYTSSGVPCRFCSITQARSICLGNSHEDYCLWKKLVNMVDRPEQDIRIVPREIRGDGPCERCGTVNNIIWFTDNVFWNEVTGQNLVHEQRPTSILCIRCFVIMTHEKGIQPTGWRLIPEFPRRYRVRSIDPGPALAYGHPGSESTDNPGENLSTLRSLAEDALTRANWGAVENLNRWLKAHPESEVKS